MASLPIFQSPIQALQMLQTKWKSIIEPVLSNELNNGQLLKNIALKSGINVINHKLGRMQIGYILADNDSPAIIYRSAALNDKTLILTSSQACNVALWVY